MEERFCSNKCLTQYAADNSIICELNLVENVYFENSIKYIIVLKNGLTWFNIKFNG